jgi:rSAM/selenodomain-associated transferase 2/rSAM/selenodomain-associated transferase 1
VLGPEGAALVQQQMTEHTLGRARGALADRACVEVRFAGGHVAAMQDAFGNGLRYRPQGGGDLGERMLRAFCEASNDGLERTVIIGADCPAIEASHLREAFDSLQTSDLVLGPAHDGGYYLIGMRRPIGEIFCGISWGTNDVLRSTLAAADRAGLKTSLLETLPDVDRPEDLSNWLEIKASSLAEETHSISVLIPTRNEAVELRATLESLLSADDVEVIVVDAKSEDDTRTIAQEAGATVLSGVLGRGRQMNAGAAVAAGRNLLFLHADTCLPEGFDSQVRQTLAQPGVAGGAFRLEIRNARRSLRLVERAANFRAQRLKMPYGDQALFLRAETFHQLGGFPDLPIMEDFQFVRTLRARGRIEILERAVVTSDRRWRALGPWRTTLINQLVILGYHLGVSPDRLADFYRRRA